MNQNTTEIATTGHNNPPPDVTLNPVEIRDRLEKQYDALFKKAKDLIGAKARILPKCETEEYATKLTNFVKQSNDTIKLLNKNRLDENKPYKAAGATVDDVFNALGREVEAIKEKARLLLDNFMAEKIKEEQRKRREAEEALRLEAEAQAKAASKLQDAGQERDAAKTMHAANKLADHAEHQATLSTKKTAEVAQVRGASANASVRTRWVGEIVAREELDLEKLRPFLSMDALQRAVQMFVDQGNRELKGANIYEKNTTVVR